jgi:hypothetical protein
MPHATMPVAESAFLNIGDELYDQSPPLADAFVAWLFDTLSTNQRIALYRKMAA